MITRLKMAANVFQLLATDIAGVEQGKVILLGGRPSMGKTALAWEIALHVACNLKQRVTYFSLEDKDASAGLLRRQQIDSVAIGKNILLNMGPAWNMDQIKELVENKGPFALVVIEYLQILSPVQKSIATKRQTAHMAMLQIKELAKETGAFVLVTSALSRRPESRKGHLPKLSDIRFEDKSKIASCADVIWLLYREGYYDINANQTIGKCVVAKNSYGKAGQIDLSWSSELGLWDKKSKIL